MGGFRMIKATSALGYLSRSLSGRGLRVAPGRLGSVPRSIEDPLLTNASNINGFLNMLVASRDAGVNLLSTPPPARLMATTPACRKSRSKSAARSHPTP